MLGWRLSRESYRPLPGHSYLYLYICVVSSVGTIVAEFRLPFQLAGV